MSPSLDHQVETIYLPVSAVASNLEVPVNIKESFGELPSLAVILILMPRNALFNPLFFVGAVCGQESTGWGRVEADGSGSVNRASGMQYLAGSKWICRAELPAFV